MDIEEIEALRTILTELVNRCTALSERAGVSPTRCREYEDAVHRYREIDDELRIVLEQRSEIIDPVPRGQLETEIERVRHERISETAQVIHDALAADTPVETIVEQYPELARQVTASELCK
ncbi:hypothetical protein [Haloarcula amylovorans]|uniref:hypothetical protein n=1 Tax=Haloarcula amylovorans TaxID=2562280 RepID=UPI0010768326|nr:hypothetical protein [Halomicroarcula amylolytica]